MTAAFNLSQLANNLNTSGQLDATDGLVGSVPVANGGTGRATLTSANVLVGNGTGAVNFVAPGASGNALISNGSAWTSGTIAKLSTAAGSAPSYSARAWGSFIGGSSPTLTGGNFSSIVYAGAGAYYVNFSTAMDDATYAVTMANVYPAGNTFVNNALQAGTRSPSQFFFLNGQYSVGGPNFFNGFEMMFAVFR